MKIKTILFVLFLVVTCAYAKAQNNSGWQPVWLGTIDGTNGYKGVEAYYQVTSCNNNEVVQLKLINHNSFKVRAGWKGIVLTNGDQKLPGNNQADSVTVAANDGEVTGDCTGSTPSLTRNLSDFSATAADIKTYLTTNFGYIIIR